MEEEEGQAVEKLTALLVDNPEFERLEALLDEFNLFEAIDMVRDEVKHSAFLAFLLDPTQPHGLADSFLSRFLQRAIQYAPRADLPVTPLDIELWNLADAEVLREWRNIDICILSRFNRFAVVIENKIQSGEHSNQLDRYLEIVREAYPDWRVLPLLLSPDGWAPSHPEYLSANYTCVAALVEEFTQARAGRLGPDVRVAMAHYAAMLRRHIVKESTVRDLCEDIYRKHRRALDLIFEHRQGFVGQIKERLLELVTGEPALQRVIGFPSGQSFLPESWLDWVPRSDDSSWSSDGYMLMFWFEVGDNGVRLILEIGPGDRQIAQKMLTAANQNRPLFDPQSISVSKKYNRIYRKRMISAKAMADRNVAHCLEELDEAWAKFVGADLALMGERLEAANRVGFCEEAE